MLYTDIVFSFNLTISERAGDVSRQKQAQNERFYILTRTQRLLKGK